MKIRTITADETLPIRREVLKPGLPESEVHFEGDDHPSALHLGAFDGERLIGIATFFPEPSPREGGDRNWRLRGMAVVASARGGGIGGELIDAGVARIAGEGGDAVWCNGRTSARRFYERHGFEAVGDEFESPHTGPHYLFVRRAESDAGRHTMDDERAIRELFSTWKRATKVGDVATVLTLIAEDAVFLAPARPPIRGRQEVEALYRQVFALYEIEQEFVFEEIRVSGDLAFCWGHDSAVMRPTDGGPERRARGYGMTIFTRDGEGRWLVARGINNMTAVADDA